MKNIKVLFFLLIILTFISSSIIINSLKEKDPLMIEIKNKKSKYKTKAINAEIIGNSIISGVYGKDIDYNKTYHKMKVYGTYNESLTCFKEVKPTISIEDNYDKYLIGSANSNRKIALIFTGNNLDKVIPILEREQIQGTFFIDENNITNSKLLKSNHEFELLSYHNTYDESLFKTAVDYIENTTKNKCNYCYTVSDNDKLLNLCKKLKLHTVKPTIEINNNLLHRVKNNLDKGNIISIKVNNYTLKELNTTIKYLKNKGYSFVTLDNLLIEKN
ncbi:MAG: hypothetical protein IKE63_02015 [Bacilli bacterium]|nr:hypothetical protein [Bacilli bacterium]